MTELTGDGFKLIPNRKIDEQVDRAETQIKTIKSIEFFSLQQVLILLRGEDFEKMIVEMSGGPPVDGEEEVADTDQDVVPERADYGTVTVCEELLASQHEELRQIED